MTTADQLKLYAVRYRWAWEELVVDAKLTEANVLYSGEPLAAFCYLKQALAVEGKSNRWQAVKAMRKELRRSKCTTPDINHKSVKEVKQEQFRILKGYPHAMEEILYLAKLKEAEQVCGTVNAMFNYLQGVCGGAKGTLSALKQIVHVQGERRKSQCLQELV